MRNSRKLVTLMSGGVAAWTPASPLPEGGNTTAIWLKASDGLYQDTPPVTPATANNQAVRVWQDQSGNARHFVAGTDGARPLLKTGILNNLPVVRADGSNDYMDYLSNNLALPYTLFVVTACLVDQDSLVFEGFESSGFKPSLYIANSSGWKWVVVHATVGSYKTTPTIGTGFHLHRVVFADSGSHFIDGVSKNTGDFNYNNSTHTKLSIFGRGGGYPYNGDIAELLIYVGTPSANDIANVETYLTTKYFP